MRRSTNLPQPMGDAATMRVIRTHNAIIRGALADLGGREVKHTGDGMMASFASVTRAVECSIAILRKFDAHNRENPDMPIRVRIGAAAGEPVEEGQDLFGAAVQLGSRICDCAEPGPVLVSNVVRQLAIGQGVLLRR